MGIFVGIAVGVWVLTLIVWKVVSRTVQGVEVDRMKNRLTGVSKEKKGKKAKKEPTLIQAPDQTQQALVLRLLERFRYSEWAHNLLEQAGLRWRPARLAHACLAGVLAGYTLGYYCLSGRYRTLALGAAILGGALPLLYVLRARRSRLRKFEALFPESLEFVARSMRAGHAFSVSLEMIHREFPEPLSGEFRRTFDEHNLGLPLDTALLKFSKRVPLMDVHFFVSAVLLQRRTGGNLAEILDKLAGLIRERFKLRGKVRAISAHGKMTGLALSCIPIVVALLLFYLNPDYGKFFLTDPTGQMLAGAAVLLQALGYGIIKKIVTIEV